MNEAVRDHRIIRQTGEERAWLTILQQRATRRPSKACVWQDFMLAKTTTDDYFQCGCFLITTLPFSLCPEIGIWQSLSAFMCINSFGTPTYPRIEGVCSITPNAQQRAPTFREATRLNGQDTKPVPTVRAPQIFRLPEQCLPYYTKLFLVLEAADLVVWRLYQKKAQEFPSVSPGAVISR